MVTAIKITEEPLSLQKGSELKLLKNVNYCNYSQMCNALNEHRTKLYCCILCAYMCTHSTYLQRRRRPLPPLRCSSDFRSTASDLSVILLPPHTQI